jgi:hypothetical protein
MISLQFFYSILRINPITIQCRMFGTLGHSAFHKCSFVNVYPSSGPANGQHEGHPEDIRPSVSGVARPGRVQDPHHFDMAYQGIVDYHSRPLH